jgi:hypothetical protein
MEKHSRLLTHEKNAQRMHQKGWAQSDPVFTHKIRVAHLTQSDPNWPTLGQAGSLEKILGTLFLMLSSECSRIFQSQHLTKKFGPNIQLISPSFRDEKQPQREIIYTASYFFNFFLQLLIVFFFYCSYLLKFLIFFSDLIFLLLSLFCRNILLIWIYSLF